MNDDDMLSTMRRSLTSVKDSLTDVEMRQPARAFEARARTRRLRRAGPGAGAAGLALVACLAVAVHGGSPAAKVGANHRPGGRSVHVNLAAWSVNTTSDGLLAVTIRELSDPALLRQALAQAGVPAVVYFGQFCNTTADEIPASPKLSQIFGPPATSPNIVAFTINPAVIPAGVQINLDVAIDHGSYATQWGLIYAGAKLYCILVKDPISVPQNLPSANGGVGGAPGSQSQVSAPPAQTATP